MAFVFPDPSTTPEFTAANGVVYAYDYTDGKWVVKSSPFQGDYVKKTGGDIMDGPLLVMGDRSPNADGVESTIKAYNVDSGRDGDLQLKRNGQTKIYCSGTGIAVQGNLKMNVEASTLKSSTNTDLMTFNKNGVFYEGAYTAAKHIATKQNLDDVNDAIGNQIIELEEEIEALAPTTERGSWTLNLAGTVAVPGQFTMYDGAYSAPGIQPNGKIQDVESIWFNEIDASGTPHGFAGVEENDLLELFVDGAPEYGLWSVVGTPHYETAAGASFWVIDVNFQRTLEDDTSFHAGDLCRLKIFKAPEGGSASDFVKKTGDEMSGPLKLETAQEDENYSTISGQARVIFENTKPSDNSKKAVNLFQPGDKNGLVTNADFYTKGDLFTTGYIKAWDGSSNNIPNPRVHLGSTTGYLRWGSFQELSWDNTGGSLMVSNNTKLQWTHGGVIIHKPLADNTSGNGFIVRGKVNTGSWTSNSVNSSNGLLLSAYHNANSTDAINYYGKITGSKNITTKEYVDSKMPQYLITKSNGNYYVS